MSWVRFPSPAPCPTVLCRRAVSASRCACWQEGGPTDAGPARTASTSAEPPPTCPVPPAWPRRRRRLVRAARAAGACPARAACLPAPASGENAPYVRAESAVAAAGRGARQPSPCAACGSEEAGPGSPGVPPKGRATHCGTAPGRPVARSLRPGEGGAPLVAPSPRRPPAKPVRRRLASPAAPPPCAQRPQRPAARIASAKVVPHMLFEDAPVLQHEAIAVADAGEGHAIGPFARQRARDDHHRPPQAIGAGVRSRRRSSPRSGSGRRCRPPAPPAPSSADRRGRP